MSMIGIENTRACIFKLFFKLYCLLFFEAGKLILELDFSNTCVHVNIFLVVYINRKTKYTLLKRTHKERVCSFF